MTWIGFEQAIPAVQLPQNHALDRATTGRGRRRHAVLIDWKLRNGLSGFFLAQVGYVPSGYVKPEHSVTVRIIVICSEQSILLEGSCSRDRLPHFKINTKVLHG
jgi:hypothetical protein